ncbi:uncharacterized protein METZ01_LOCUS514991, partial [marine metagenome]
STGTSRRSSTTCRTSSARPSAYAPPSGRTCTGTRRATSSTTAPSILPRPRTCSPPTGQATTMWSPWWKGSAAGCWPGWSRPAMSSRGRPIPGSLRFHRAGGTPT